LSDANVLGLRGRAVLVTMPTGRRRGKTHFDRKTTYYATKVTTKNY